MSQVSLINLNKSFGEVIAVRNLDLEIQQGEFFSFLGPSGCGKTTTLRMIAGFEFPATGRILFDGKDVTVLPANRRNAGMVFQNYALFPHMTVFENVAFGLQARKIAKTEIRRRVRDALKLVELTNLAPRKVTELSGGQQQRVALARAIVIEPMILLLDEPLSNLDAKLRVETRDEIRALQRRLGITTIYVTHDQEEALSLSDRIAVMNQGICHQVGTPAEIYQNPRDRFVARFVGNSNILEGIFSEIREGLFQVEIAPDWRVQVESNSNDSFINGQSVSISLRPESISLDNRSDSDLNVFEGTIQKVSYSGAIIDYEVDVFGHILRIKRFINENGLKRKVGEKVLLQVHPSQIIILK